MKKIYNVIVKLGDESKRNEFQKDLAVFTDIKLHFADDKAGIRNPQILLYSIATTLSDLHRTALSTGATSRLMNFLSSCLASADSKR